MIIEQNTDDIRAGVVTIPLTNDIQAQAVASVLHTDMSAIVTLKSSGIDRPKQLDGRKYASYGVRGTFWRAQCHA